MGHWAYLVPFQRQTTISVENCKIYPPSCILPPLTGYPLELGIGAGVRITGMMVLPDGPKSFKIGLAV